MTIEERVEFLTQSIESHDRQLGEITEKLDKITQATADNAEAITSLIGGTGNLLEIARAHEGRISGLEGGRN